MREKHWKKIKDEEMRAIKIRPKIDQKREIVSSVPLSLQRQTAFKMSTLEYY